MSPPTAHPHQPRQDEAQGSAGASDSSTRSPARPGTYHGSGGSVPAPALRYSFEDGAGTTVTDDSGGGNAGTLSPDAGWEAPASNPAGGTAGLFDGARHVTSSGRVISATQHFTVAAWVRPPSAALSSNREVVRGTGTWHSPYRLEMRENGGSPVWAFTMMNGANQYESATVLTHLVDAAVALGTWTHIAGALLVLHIREVGATVTCRQATTAASYDHGGWHHLAGMFNPVTGVHLYVHGELQAANPDAQSAESYDGYVRIGGDDIHTWTQVSDGSTTAENFQGDMDGAAWFDQVLTTQKVARPYHASF